MSIDLPLDDMSTEEKMLLIENIWGSLRGSGEDVPSPKWHREELARREQSVSDDESQFVDWDKAKKDIRKTIQ